MTAYLYARDLDTQEFTPHGTFESVEAAKNSYENSLAHDDVWADHEPEILDVDGNVWYETSAFGPAVSWIIRGTNETG